MVVDNTPTPFLNAGILPREENIARYEIDLCISSKWIIDGGAWDLDEYEERFKQAKETYEKLINEDFPDFNFDDYIQDKAREREQSDLIDPSQAEKKSKLNKRIFSALDLSGDGKLDVSDLLQMPKAAAKGAASTAKSVGKTVSEAVTSFDVAEA